MARPIIARDETDPQTRAEEVEEQLRQRRDSERRRLRFRKQHGRDPFSFPIVVKQQIGVVEEDTEGESVTDPIEAAFATVGKYVSSDGLLNSTSAEFEFTFAPHPDTPGTTFSIKVDAK